MPLPLLGALRRQFAPSPPAIADEQWRACLHGSRLLGGLAAGEQAALRELSAQLLATKSFVGVAGLELTEAMRLAIAVQAGLPILHLGLHWYDGWSGIVVYPARFRVHRRREEEDGTVHESLDELSGEAWEGGPVVLSWADAAGESLEDGVSGIAGGNVVIHEFAHKLDLRNGVADGVPPFDPRRHAGIGRERWLAVLDDSLERLRAGVDIAEEAIPRDIDPESAAANPYYAALPLDPYAATDEAEFFAVSSEAFFTEPARLRDAFPAWYELLESFYRPR
jgi:MtfA peptidase